MLNNSFKYYNTESFIHFINPLCKLLVFIIFIFMVIFSHSIKSMVALFIVISFIVGLSNIPYKLLFNSVWYFKYFILFLFLLGIFFNNFFLPFKFCFIIIFYSILIMSTKIDSLIGGFYSLFKPLEVFELPVFRYSVFCGLIFNFVPFFIDEYCFFYKLQCSRGFFSGFKYKVVSFICVFFSTFRKILKKRDIMLIRGVNCCNSSCVWHLPDVYIVSCYLIVFVFVLVKEVVV